MTIKNDGYLKETITYTYETSRDGYRTQIECNPETKEVCNLGGYVMNAHKRGLRKRLINACPVFFEIHSMKDNVLYFNCIWISKLYTKPIRMRRVSVDEIGDNLMDMGLYMDTNRIIYDFDAFINMIISSFIENNLCEPFDNIDSDEIVFY